MTFSPTQTQMSYVEMAVEMAVEITAVEITAVEMAVEMGRLPWRRCNRR